MKTKRFNKTLMLFLTFGLLAFKTYGQAYMLWDFEDWTSIIITGCTIETTDPDPDGGVKYLKTSFPDYGWYYDLYQDLANINVAAMENPLLVFDYKTGVNTGKFSVWLFSSVWYEVQVNYYFRSPDWKQIAIPLKYLFDPEFFTPAVWISGVVPQPIVWPAVTGFAIELHNWVLPEGTIMEMSIDNICLKAESQKLFDFEDGVKPQELPEFTIETTEPDTAGGLKYLKVAKSGIAQWTWIGAAEKQIPITNLSVYNKPLVSFLYKTGSKKGYLQVEVGDNADMKWGYSVGQLESSTWKSMDVSLFDAAFSNWATDPLNWSKVQYIKIGFTTGDLPAGSDYEISIDNIRLKETPQNYQPFLRDFTIESDINEDLAFRPEWFKNCYTDFDKDTLVKIKFINVPDAKNGALKLDDTPVNAGQEIAVTDIGKLKFVPSPDWWGTSVIKWTASDGELFSAEAVLNLTLSHHPNLALHQPVEVSSSRSIAEYANDAIMHSVWGGLEYGPRIAGGGYAVTSWMYVDLGFSQEISSAFIHWEDAYALKYNVEVSDDALTWAAVDSVENGDGGVDRISFAPVTARYVRIYIMEAVSIMPPNVRELEVYHEMPPLTSFPIENVLYGKVDNADDNAGFVEMHWNNDSVFMHFVIKDDSIVTAGTAYQVDNIEVYFDMDNSKRIHWPRNGPWMANDTTFDDNDYQFRIVPAVPWEVNNPIIGEKLDYTRKGAGYEFMLSIPWDSLMPGFVPEIGKEIGFDILVSDNDAIASDANRNQISWNAPTTFLWNDPSLWGVLKLDDSATFVPVPDLEKPTAPASLDTIIEGNKVTLTWDPSTDNRVVHYYILLYDKNIVIDTVLAKPSDNKYTIEGLSNDKHTIMLYACDPYGNKRLSTIKLPAGWWEEPSGINDIESERLRFYPNPAGDVIYLGDIMKEKAVIEIYNLSGQLMMTCRVDAGNKEINITALPQGMYTIRLRDSKEVRIAKLIKN